MSTLTLWQLPRYSFISVFLSHSNRSTIRLGNFPFPAVQRNCKELWGLLGTI